MDFTLISPFFINKNLTFKHSNIRISKVKIYIRTKYENIIQKYQVETKSAAKWQEGKEGHYASTGFCIFKQQNDESLRSGLSAGSAKGIS